MYLVLLLCIPTFTVIVEIGKFKFNYGVMFIYNEIYVL